MENKKIFIDCVIFQKQKGRPAGISRVWLSLLTEISKTSLAEKVVLLDRGGSMPQISGLKKITINEYVQNTFESDSLYLQYLINENGGGLFVSTYYTYPENSPCVIILHDMTPEATSLDLNHPEWRAKQKAIEKCSAFFSVSEATKKDFFKYYPQCSSKPVIVIPNAVSDNFQVSAEWERKLFCKIFSIKKPYFIFSGHRLGYKNAISFFKAFDLLDNKSDFELFFTGGASRIEKVFLKYLQSTKAQVQFLTDKELAVAYSGAIALVYPSLYEGFGLPVLEAMRAGCPVVAGNNSSLPEVAGDSAILVDSKDIYQLKDALIEVQKPSIRNDLIIKGFENIKRFSWEKTGEILVQSLDSLLNNLSSLQINQTGAIDTWERYIFTFYNHPELSDLLKAFSDSIKCYNSQGLSFDFAEMAEVEKRIVKLITDADFEYLLSACKNSDKDHILIYWCGMILEAKNRLDEALDLYIKLSGTSLPNMRTSFLAAKLAYRLGRKLTAEKLYEILVMANNNYNEGILRLKELKSVRSRIKEGMQIKQVDLSPYGHPEIRHEMKADKEPVFISIILPTKDRNEGLEEILNSLPLAMYKLRYEIILISGKKSIKELQPLVSKYNIDKIFYDEDIFAPGEKFNWPKLMNFGFANSSGNWVVYASDDIEFYPFSFWNAFSTLHIDENVGGITFLHKNNVESYNGVFDNYGFDQTAHYPYINFGLINKRAFDASVRFDEKFKFYWADVDLCMSLWEAGYRIEVSPYSIVDHNNITDRLKQENSGDRYFSDTAYFYSKWNNKKLLLNDEILLKKRIYLQPRDLLKVFNFILAELLDDNEIYSSSKDKLLIRKIEQVITSVSKESGVRIDTGFKVSAIVSTYNSERFLRGCLDDLINQTLYKKGELEIVVVNSGSQQGEDAIVKEYQLKYKNIKYVKTGREPIYKAWNRGIKIASGKYLTNANTDDRHRHDALEILSALLDEDENTGLVYADQFVTYKENQTFEIHVPAGTFEWPEFDRAQLIHCSICGPQPTWRKSLHDRFGYFDESLIVAGDYEWWLRISENVRLKHLPEKLGLYLLAEDSIEHRYTDEMRNETSIVRSRYAEKMKINSLDYNRYRSSFLKLYEYQGILFSVIITTFNRPKQLIEAVESVLTQSCPNLELIIVNDGGNSVSGAMRNIKDERIKIINRTKTEGPAAARNTGIKNSSGKYIAFLDDDDLFYGDHLETALKSLRTGHRVVYTDSSRFSYRKNGDDYRLIKKSVPYSIDYEREKLLLANISPVNCFVFERELLDLSGLFNEKFKVLEDWEFWLRLSKHAEFYHIKKTTVQVNWRDDGTTITSSKQKDFQIFREMIYNSYSDEINKIGNKEQIIAEFQTIWKNDSLNKPIVSIVVPTYNQFEYTKEFVESVYKLTHIPFELIVIVNNKEDGTSVYLSELSEKHDNINMIINDNNLGFPASINLGIKASASGFVLVINNDVVVTEGWIERLVDIANNDEQVGMVGPISNEVSGLQKDNNAKYGSIEEMHRYADGVRKKNKDQIQIFPRIAFLCTLIKRNVIDMIGGLDERFTPGNYEDDDYCLRAQLAGFKTVIAKDVFIHHYGSKSFKAEGNDKYAERLEINKQKFIAKWGVTPDELWLHKKEINPHQVYYPISNNKFDEQFERARVLLADKELELASEALHNALENYYSADQKKFQIEYPELLDLAGSIALAAGDIESAKNYFEEELRLAPNSSSACVGLGECLFIQEQYEAAKTMYEWGAKNDPENQNAVYALAKVNNLLGHEELHNSLVEIN